MGMHKLVPKTKFMLGRSLIEFVVGLHKILQVTSVACYVDEIKGTTVDIPCFRKKQ